MAYASDLLAFPFRSVALHSLRSSNLARHQSTMMMMKIMMKITIMVKITIMIMIMMLCIVVASPTSRSASLHYANPSMYNAFLVLFEAKCELEGGRGRVRRGRGERGGRGRGKERQ